MRIHWLQHADFEGLGSIEAWLLDQGHVLRGTRLQRGETPPGVEAFDALIVMGGPMNIHEHAQYPWLRTEKALIRAAIDHGRRVLGICLGAQLIADALGGPVSRHDALEIGWWPLQLTEEGRRHPLFAGLPATFTSFHWHGDTWALPPGAVRLASSAACAQQAFAWDGSRVLGLQFHPEVTLPQAVEWFRHESVTAARWVQDADSILADQAGFAANARLVQTILARFFAS